jgi:hypothetical protein
MQAEIRSGDSDYTALYAQWVTEGEAASFEYLNETEETKSLWYVRERSSAPVFLKRAEARLTEAGNEKPIEWRPSRGYEVEMPQMGLKFTEGPGGPGDIKIRMEDFPRNASV